MFSYYRSVKSMNVQPTVCNVMNMENTGYIPNND